jgi:hypothetical protein
VAKCSCQGTFSGARGAIVVPAQQIEIYQSLGFRLVDEPHCSGARMALPSVSVHRVQCKETAGRNGRCEPARKHFSNDRGITAARKTQARARQN